MILIRKALPDDARSIKQIQIAAYQAAYRGLLSDEYLNALVLNEDVVHRTKNFLSKPEITAYVAVKNDQIVGFAYVVYPRLSCFEIMAIYIRPDQQRQSIGRRMVENICAEKKAAGYKVCEAWTLKNGPSVGFYQKTGFRQDLSQEKISERFSLPLTLFYKKL